MRLKGIEDGTWWDDYRGATTKTEDYPWQQKTTKEEPAKEPTATYPWRG